MCEGSKYSSFHFLLFLLFFPLLLLGYSSDFICKTSSLDSWQLRVSGRLSTQLFNLSLLTLPSSHFWDRPDSILSADSYRWLTDTWFCVCVFLSLSILVTTFAYHVKNLAGISSWWNQFLSFFQSFDYYLMVVEGVLIWIWISVFVFLPPVHWFSPWSWILLLFGLDLGTLLLEFRFGM